ncbi:sulfurtransferase [Halobacteria archaeon AArc-m2/3/4]|uniref:Sulfurtransferase n=1 Tax=Natronoglomus mannanivorans TaxID=2979990 RepID=A0ABT2QAS3_9EURY|nr:sulfurtransferase [Halobacteria archaeon AArc-m2/3/4]
MDEFVVTPAWLSDRLEDPHSQSQPQIRIVDVREPWEFEGIGHVPGAVNIPFDRFRDEGDADRGMLPGSDVFAELVEEAGIEPDDTIVAYDDTHGVFAARFVVTALLYGHEDVRLLDGDYSAWNREYETTSDASEVEASSYEPEPLALEESPLIEREDVERAIDRGALLVDTREQFEFEEARLPGAVRFDWREVVDDETRGLKPRAEIEALLAERGITPDRELVLYCNTARRISHTYVVLRALGYEDVSFYEGSLTEWLAADGRVESGPVSSSNSDSDD